MKKLTPIAELKVAQGFRCDKPRCAAVHFVCPGCGGEASVFASQTTPIFSATCAEEINGDDFLVDSRTVFATRRQ